MLGNFLRLHFMLIDHCCKLVFTKLFGSCCPLSLTNDEPFRI